MCATSAADVKEIKNVDKFNKTFVKMNMPNRFINISKFNPIYHKINQFTGIKGIKKHNKINKLSKK